MYIYIYIYIYTYTHIYTCICTIVASPVLAALSTKLTAASMAPPPASKTFDAALMAPVVA